MDKVDIDTFISIMQSQLKVCYVNSNRSSMTVRCFVCGDSRKNSKHAHLNIRLSDPTCLVWRCPRCDASGIVNMDFIRSLELYDSTLLNVAHTNDMNLRKLTRKIAGSSKHGLRTIVNPMSNTKQAHNIVAYCNERLGVDLPMETWVHTYNVVVDLRALYKANPWLKLHDSKDKLARLADEGCGFLSADHSTIIFRDMYKLWKKRYYNYNVYGTNLPNFSTAYMPACTVDITKQSYINVALTEGIFDIIGVREHCQKPSENTVYLACGGKGYLSAITKLTSLGYLDQRINIYSDDDVDIDVYRKWKLYNDIFKLYPVNVFYNTLSKDVGVPANKINLKQYRI